MTTKEYLEKFKDYKMQTSAYRYALEIMYFDMQTTAPAKSGEYRNDRMSYLEGVSFKIETDPENIEMLTYLSNANDVDDLTKKEATEILKNLRKTLNIPVNEYMDYVKVTLDSANAWEDAYHKNDYSLFEPYLKKVIEGRINLLKYRDDYGQKSNYDLLLDDFEPGMNQKEYDKFFELIKTELVPLIKEIVKKKPINQDFLFKHYPREKQKEVMLKLMEYMNFDFETGILSESLHPFTMSLSKYDNRITTKYLEDKLDSSIFSVIHEAGHATYNAQVDDSLADTYFFDNMSMGMHESQSRLCENYLGRNKAFWQCNYHLLQEAYPEELKKVSLDEFVDAINASYPSLIRTEADELTYPLHILVRYELEKSIINGEITLDNLDKVWADKYEEYLGIRPNTDAEGILQDMHWSDGTFGYFPTYALGSAYGAQFMHAMRKDLDVEKCLRENNFKEIRNWLKEHIQKYGGYNLPKEQIKIATGEEFNPRYYIDYLKDKYSKLYNID